MTVETFYVQTDCAAARAAADKLYEQIAPQLHECLPPSADIRHIGATAVPGCMTKGDLDIVVRVPAADFPAAEVALAACYPANTGNLRTAAFASFEDGSSSPPLGIQLTAIDGLNDMFHHFTAALAADPA